jgi:hypothetical protein
LALRQQPEHRRNHHHHRNPNRRFLVLRAGLRPSLTA